MISCLRMALVGLFCMMAAGCRKQHPKPVPDPSLDELRGTLLQAVLGNLINGVRPGEPAGSSGQPLASVHSSGVARGQTQASADNAAITAKSLAATALAVDAVKVTPDEVAPAGNSSEAGVAPSVQSTSGTTDRGGEQQPPRDVPVMVGVAATMLPLAGDSSVPTSPAPAEALGSLDAETAVLPTSVSTDDSLRETTPSADKAEHAPPELPTASSARNPTELNVIVQPSNSTEFATRYGAGTGFTGVLAGASGDTGVGAGAGHTSVGAGTGHTGVGAGQGSTGITAGPGSTGITAGLGSTGITAGQGSTGITAERGLTEIGAGSAADAGVVVWFTPWGPMLFPVALASTSH